MKPFIEKNLLFSCLCMFVVFTACRTTPKCDTKGNTKYGTQRYNLQFVRLDSVPCWTPNYDTCFNKEIVFGSSNLEKPYIATLMTVYLDTTGGNGNNVVYLAPNSKCSNVSRLCGPYVYGTEDRVVGRDYRYTYSYFYDESELLGRLQVNFQMRADICKTVFSKIDYYWNSKLLPEYSYNPNATIEVFIAPTKF